MRALALVVLAVAALVAACRKAPPVRPDEPVSVPAVPDVVPPALAAADYVGADACTECHRVEYDAWRRSPHGRAMAVASPDTVLGGFDGGSLEADDGKITFTRVGDDYFVEVTAGGRREKRKVDLVLASGRQHQLYVARGDHEMLSLVPAVWSTTTKTWLPLSLYQPVDLSAASPRYWAAQDMTRGCLSCHLSQFHRSTGQDGATNEWVDLPVNCESCHGPGREHVRRRRAGDANEVYRDLSKLGSVQESRVCGGCHGLQMKRYVFPPGPDGLPQIFVTSLVNEGLRPDGTQHLTSYQYPGHVLSAGFAQKLLRCKDCHAPHGLEARNSKGESAVGALSNRQCTGCHEKMTSVASVRAHSRHSAKVRCVDCHMAYSWIGDDDRRHQRTSDHSISIPHPQESLAFGTPDACTTCHGDKSPAWAVEALTRWGQKTALGMRPWVDAIAEGRKAAPGATQKLVALLTDPDTGEYLRASALDLLSMQPADAGVVDVVAPYVKNPEPYLRAAAIRALDVHDVAGRQRWRAQGLADDHPFVRMETFSLFKDVEHLLPADMERDLQDVLTYMSPPTDGIVHLVTVHHRRGELREALSLVGVLERIMLPVEKQRMHLDEVRGRIEADMAKRDASAVTPGMEAR